VNGSGTANYIPRWTDATTIGNSAIFQQGSFISIGDETAAYPLDVLGRANATELGLAGSFIDSWSDLILNQLNPAQTANFNITGDGAIGTKLTVSAGPLELPSTNTTYRNAIERYDGILQGYNISQRYIFGGEPGAHWGMGFFVDNLTNTPIVVINDDREVHLGYVGAATQLCLYGSGDRVCRNQWPSGDSGVIENTSQVIWNSQGLPPLGGFPQNTASIKIDGSIALGSQLYAGATYTGDVPTNATLFAGLPGGSVGIHQCFPFCNTAFIYIPVF